MKDNVKRPNPRKTKSRERTQAWITLERNLDEVSHMLDFSRHEADLLLRAAKRTGRRITKGGEIDTLIRTARSLVKALDTQVKRLATAHLWQVVVLVTCIEAYLQDLLVAAAGIDPELMKDSKQSAPYAVVVSATSLEELASDLRRRWARGWLDGGGPTRWISRLTTMGARGYPDDLGQRLELFWGVRHVAVHAAGFATAEFVKRHPEAVRAPGDRVRVNIKDIGIFLSLTKQLLEPTERFFLARWPSLTAPETEPRE